MSQSTARRGLLVKEAVRSLNWVSGSFGESRPSSCPPTLQEEFMCDTWMVARDASLTSEHGHEKANVALQELLRGHSTCDVDFGPSTTLAPKNSHLVVSLSELEESGADLSRSKIVVKRAWLLRIRKTFALPWTGEVFEEKRCDVGLFLVQHKSGQQRMIMDCRGANLHFKSAPSVSLCISESLARIEVMLQDYVVYGTRKCHERFEKLAVSIGMTDVSNCFHRIRIFLSRYFAMLPVKAKSMNLVGCNNTWLFVQVTGSTPLSLLPHPPNTQF